MKDPIILKRNTNSGVQGNDKVDTRPGKFKTNDPSTSTFSRTKVALNAPLDTTGESLMGFGDKIQGISNDVERREVAKRAFEMEGAMKIADKLDTNAVNRLVDGFDLFSKTSLDNTKSSGKDFTNKAVVKAYLAEIEAERVKVLADPSVGDLSEVARLDLDTRLSTRSFKTQDDVNKYSLSVLNSQGDTRFNTKVAQHQDEPSVNAVFDRKGDSIGYYLAAFKDLATQSIGTVDLLKSQKFQVDAVQFAQDTVFNYHMRNNDPQSAEDSLDDGRFDLVDGSLSNKEHRKRLREYHASPQVERWDAKLGENVHISQTEASRDPGRYKPKKNMEVEDNKKAYVRAKIKMLNVDKKDPAYMNEEALAKVYNLPPSVQATLDAEMEAVNKRAEMVQNPAEREVFRKALIVELNEKYAPPTEEEEGRRDARKKEAEVKEGIKIIEKAKNDKRIDEATMEALQAKFAPVVRMKDKTSNSIRAHVTLTVTGRVLSNKEFTALDSIQRGKIMKVSSEAERILSDKKHSAYRQGMGNNEAVEAAANVFIKDDPDFLVRNVFLQTAESILGRVNGTNPRGTPAEAPMSEPIPAGYDADDLNAEITALLKTQEGIKVERTTGLGSALSSFLSNLPGQYLGILDDQETIRARTALLRVSREILVLVMKNDRFAMAEQTIVSPLLDKPSALISAETIKTKLRSFQKELKLEMARSMRNIKAGIHPGKELDKIIDFDRIDSLINQFNLTSPIEEATPEGIEKSNSQQLSDFQGDVSDSDLLERPEILDALIKRQQELIKKYAPSSDNGDNQSSDNSNNQPSDSGNIPPSESKLTINNDREQEVRPEISDLVQKLIDTEGMTPEILTGYAKDLADKLANPGTLTDDDLLNIEALLKDVQYALGIPPLPEGQ